MSLPDAPEDQRKALDRRIIALSEANKVLFEAAWQEADFRTIVTEVVFNYPGIGQLAISSVNARDYPTVQAITIISAAIFIFVNLFIDMIYMLLDPRIRIEA